MQKGERTTLTKATSKTESLRTTVPMGIVRQFGLSAGDGLDWKIEANSNQLVIVIKPAKK